ncbi:MAG: hypothetical protein AB8H86_14375 [Polyangiales bacterium]
MTPNQRTSACAALLAFMFQAHALAQESLPFECSYIPPNNCSGDAPSSDVVATIELRDGEMRIYRGDEAADDDGPDGLEEAVDDHQEGDPLEVSWGLDLSRFSPDGAWVQLQGFGPHGRQSNCGMFSADDHVAPLSWPVRPEGEYTDTARIVVFAPTAEGSSESALRAAGLLSPSQTLAQVQLRHAWENGRDAYSAELDVLLGELAPAFSALNSALTESRRAGALPDALGEAIDAFHTARQQTTLSDSLCDAAAQGSPKARVCTYLRQQRRAAPLGSIEALRVTATKVVGAKRELMQPTQLPSRTNWAEYQAQVCHALRPQPVATYDVVESEVFETSNRRARIFEFDYRAGFLGRPDDRFYVEDGDELFVRVHGLPRGQNVGVRINHNLVTTTRAERGLELGLGEEEDADSSAQERSVLSPAEDVGASSSLVLRVGVASTGYYGLSICHGDASEKCQERSGHHTLTVQGERYWGFRAGFGLAYFRDNTPGLARLQSQDAYVVTNDRDWQLDAVLPFFAVAYPMPRQLMRNDWEIGLGLGLDLLRPTRRWLAGVHVGRGPVGVMFAYQLLRQTASTALPGTMLNGPTLPNLAESYPEETRLAHGMGIFVTFDFDVFKRVYDALTRDSLPGLGGGSQ